MAWFDRNPGGKKGPEEERPVVPEAPPAASAAPPQSAPIKEPPSPAVPGLVASLHKGSRVTGQLTFQGPARIDGSVEGEILCHGKLTIGEGAEVRAKISSQIVVIQGRVEGNVAAKEKVELIAPARLYGNIDTPRLIIAEGVVFDGDCSMGSAKQKGGVASSQSVSADKAAAAAAPKLQEGGVASSQSISADKAAAATAPKLQADSKK
jgi:cytoskeletal protein CcmA (bactofilin family)